MPNTFRYRQFSSEKLENFIERGYKKRHFFPHEVYYLSKCGPDGYKLAQRMCGETDLNSIWELVLYTISPTINEFPEELFFDDDIVWHQQQFGIPGQIATANLRLNGDSLYSMVHLSDVVQRISRRREFKTRIENRFKGWPNMLLNSIMCFASENNIKNIFVPTSEFAIKHTDENRVVQEPLFQTVYDRAVNNHFVARKHNQWWEINVEENRCRIILPRMKREELKKEKTICINHDIERGLGHLDIDEKMAEEAAKSSPKCLEQMLSIERELNIKATYNVVGCIFNDVREKIEMDGHCLAFHSFDHSSEGRQLYRCKDIDYRIKGYRTPRSELTPELADEKLCFNNFEWLASSAYSFGFNEPIVENRIVKIPILFDDYDLYKRKISFEVWEKKAISEIKENEFVAFGLHDCYGKLWLPHYKEFLKKIKGLGAIKTMDQVSADTIFRYAL